MQAKQRLPLRPTTFQVYDSAIGDTLLRNGYGEYRSIQDPFNLRGQFPFSKGGICNRDGQNSGAGEGAAATSSSSAAPASSSSTSASFRPGESPAPGGGGFPAVVAAPRFVPRPDSRPGGIEAATQNLGTSSGPASAFPRVPIRPIPLRPAAASADPGVRTDSEPFASDPRTDFWRAPSRSSSSASTFRPITPTPSDASTISFPREKRPAFLPLDATEPRPIKFRRVAAGEVFVPPRGGFGFPEMTTAEALERGATRTQLSVRQRRRKRRAEEEIVSVRPRALRGLN